MSVVGTRYAQALLDLAQEKSSAADTEVALKAVVDLYQENAELREFLCNPLISSKHKREVADKAFVDAPDLVAKFTRLLIEKFRIGILPDVYAQYIELRDERENIAHMAIYSTEPLEAEKVDEIRDVFAKKLGASEFRIQTKIDPRLAGGLKVVIGDKVYDGSIRSRLSALKSAITEKLATAKH